MAHIIVSVGKTAMKSALALGMLLFAGLAAAKDTVLVLRPAGDLFTEVVQGMSGELGEDVTFSEVVVDDKANVDLISHSMSTMAPKSVVLLGNSAINLYAGYQKRNPNAAHPPSVALAALYVDRFIANLKNATGIRYEIPAVTGIVNMRSMLITPVKKVGVVYRSWMADMIAVNARYASAEGVELVAVQLPDKDSAMNTKLRSAVKDLLDKKVDALWLLNDNELLNPKALKEVWLPSIGSARVPVMVGVKSLVSTGLNLGSFAVVPDHYALGVQAASILAELMDNDWEMEEREVEQPLSVKKILNVSVMEKKGISYRQDKLGEVDEVIR